MKNLCVNRLNVVVVLTSKWLVLSFLFHVYDILKCHQCCHMQCNFWKICPIYLSNQIIYCYGNSFSFPNKRIKRTDFKSLKFVRETSILKAKRNVFVVVVYWIKEIKSWNYTQARIYPILNSLCVCHENTTAQRIYLLFQHD